LWLRSKLKLERLVSVNNPVDTKFAPNSPILLKLRFKLRLERLKSLDNVFNT